MENKPWIPDRLTKTKVLRLLKQDRLWPLPLEEDQEELLKKKESWIKHVGVMMNHLDERARANLEKSGGSSIGIELAHPGDQHRPADPS